MSSYPSIFNDVIGPVMRGPSSSHCAASLRIARLCRDLMDEEIKDILIEFDPNGSLATTHKSQGSDMGLFGGFLGWEPYDERLPLSEHYLADAGIHYKIAICELLEKHPNTYQITLSNDKEARRLTAISTGGGMIEVILIDGNKVSIAGDYHETLVYCSSSVGLQEYLEANMDYDEIIFHEGENPCLEIKSQEPIPAAIRNALLQMDAVHAVKCLHPILPIKARKNLKVPFITCAEMLAFNQDKNQALWELAVTYESERGGISRDDVFEKMRAIIRIMGNAIEIGLNGTSYNDRILGSQSPNYQKSFQSVDWWRYTQQNNHVRICNHGSKKFHGCYCCSAYCRFMWRITWRCIWRSP
jgi:L-serine dehydratase